MRSLLTLLPLMILFGCARQTTPNGGPQDKTAPTLLRSTPSNNEKNFKGNTVTLTFDEAVKLNEPREEIIIAPSVGKEISYQAKQNRIVIEFKKGLSDSTTYSIAFRDAVQDLTEGNPVENLRLAFSTGPSIDTLKLTGRVTDALTEKIPQDITVAIYQADTFNIFKHVPDYFTKSDKEGRFIISNLKGGAYRLYAFEDKNKNLKLEPKSEKFGFLPGTLDPATEADSLEVLMVTLDARPLRISNLRHSEKSSRLKFNKALTSYTATFKGTPILNTFGDDHSEIKFHYTAALTDSLAATIHAIDSLEQTLDTTVYLKSGKASGIPEPFTVALKEILINTETAVLTTGLTFTKPIQTITLDSVFLQLDSLTTIPFTLQELHYDTVMNRIDITKSLSRKLMDTLSRPLTLHIAANSFLSIEKDSRKLITKGLSIPKPEDTATLLVEIKTNKTEFVVQLLSTDYKLVRSVRNSRKITFKNIPPTEYKIRILLDRNNNSTWDPGNIIKDQPPEKTIFFKNSDGKYQFPIRANWEVGPYVISF